MATLSQGTSFSFNSVSYTVTRVTVQRGSQSGSQTRQRISTAHLGSNPDLEEPYLEIWQPRADEGGGGNTVEIDFHGSSVPTAGATGTLVISGGLSLSTTATVSGSSVTAAVGDIIKGSASFRIGT